MKSIQVGKTYINFHQLPKGHVNYRIDWDMKPHRNQFMKKGKSIIDIDIKQDIWISETLITQRLWTNITGTNPSKFNGIDKPVESVSYYEVYAFIDKLNKMTGNKFRLPTETEFLYACVLNYDDNFNGKINDTIWYEKKSENQTQPVGSKLFGKLNLSDLLGNLYQFVDSEITHLDGDKCLYKGACWATQELWIDKDYVMTISKEGKNNTIGFRMAMN
jgi:formylglycine-generating enzyme required for sulfatase activity